MLEQVKRGEVHCIIVKDFSRLGRNYVETGHYLEQVFPFLGVRFFSVNDFFDSDKNFGAAGSLDVAFKNIIYEAYSKDLSVKIKSAKKSRAEQGKFVGAFAPYGYVKSGQETKKLVVDDDCALIVKKIFMLYLDGTNQAEIARVLNQEGTPSPLMVKRNRSQALFGYTCNSSAHWTSAAIARILTDERYTGTGIHGKSSPKSVGSNTARKHEQADWVIIPDAHEAIISKEIFRKVQQLKRQYHGSGKLQKEGIAWTGLHRKEELLWTQKVYCGACNHRLLQRSSRGGNVSLFCPTWRNTDTYACYRGNLNEETLKMTILQCIRLMSQLSSGSKYMSVNQGNPGNTLISELHLKQQLSEVEAQIKREQVSLYEKYEFYKMDRISKSKYCQQIIQMNQKMDQLQQKRLIMNNHLYGYEADLTEVQRTPAVTVLTGEMANTFIKRVNIGSQGQIEINWAFNSCFHA